MVTNPLGSCFYYAMGQIIAVVECVLSDVANVMTLQWKSQVGLAQESTQWTFDAAEELIL